MDTFERSLTYTPAWRLARTRCVWEWVPWEFASEGKFKGRWDSPTPRAFRTVYAAEDPLGAYLEVLGDLPVDPATIAALEAVEHEDADERLPAVGVLNFDELLAGRYLGSGIITQLRVLCPARSGALQLWRSTPAIAVHAGEQYLDAGLLRSVYARSLTQTIAAWARDHGFGGIEYESRHGDELRAWAIFEEPANAAISPPCVFDEGSTPVTRNEPNLQAVVSRLGLTLV